MEESVLRERIRSTVKERDDIIRDEGELWPLSHPFAGKCYVASECLYYLCGQDKRWIVERCLVPVPEPGPLGEVTEFTHWYLREKETGEVVDLTSEQFTKYEHTDIEIPYDSGKEVAFDTIPSDNLKVVLESITGVDVDL